MAASKTDSVDSSLETEVPVRPETEDYITGWKLHVIGTSILFSMFVAQMESTITSTSVITITDDLGGYIKAWWVLTAYWLTAGAFQIIWAKISDIVGRKICLISALVIFTVFSGACGASQSVIQLIQFRWLQGIGGCGVLGLGQLLFFELVPPAKYPLFIGIVTAVLALSLVIGPLIGGGITVHGNWRWVFLVNVPIGVATILGTLFLFPRKLFNEPAARRSEELSFRQVMQRVDFLGCFLLLGTCLLLTTGLQQAAVGYEFTSKFVLPLLVCTAPFLVAFVVSQWFITTRRVYPEPVFPWRFCQRRARLGMMVIIWLSGGVLSTFVVQVPQRFMAVNGLSSLAAASRLLAFGALVPVGSSIALPLMNKFRIPPFAVLFGSAVLQILGTALLSQASTAQHVNPSQYGYQVLVGLGVGATISVVITMIPLVMENRDVSVATAAQSQLRILGGLVAVAIGATVTTRHLKSQLENVLPANILAALLQKLETINLLKGETLDTTRVAFGRAYNRQMMIAVGFSAVQLLAVALLWGAIPALPMLGESHGTRAEAGDGSQRGGEETFQEGKGSKEDEAASAELGKAG
ncbi:major facilitator superfamily domain-containing protein [Clohesyomyces aquaticus]|uniref:Major facilitator superfamily domain-containing protein n=1 Tax=Clohesyomyces aquaticus TaxID=1231657 RepID=A0A1Y1ZB96_9PLEO|nr:major facilitator superfamily domain-containing protein [Clohesyomyces aquaticus]